MQEIPEIFIIKRKLKFIYFWLLIFAETNGIRVY